VGKSGKQYARDPKRIWSSRGCFLKYWKKPDISILSDDFLAEVSRLPQKNLAVELLRKLLSDEIKTRSRRNVVQFERTRGSSSLSFPRKRESTSL
jgi:hypothetical protein